MKYVCENCGGNLLTQDIMEIIEQPDALKYLVEFRCKCGWHSSHYIDWDDKILYSVPFKKFSSLVQQRMEECAACEQRMYDRELDGVVPCSNSGYPATGRGCRLKEPFGPNQVARIVTIFDDDGDEVFDIVVDTFILPASADPAKFVQDIEDDFKQLDDNQRRVCRLHKAHPAICTSKIMHVKRKIKDA